MEYLRCFYRAEIKGNLLPHRPTVGKIPKIVPLVLGLAPCRIVDPPLINMDDVYYSSLSYPLVLVSEDLPAFANECFITMYPSQPFVDRT